MRKDINILVNSKTSQVMLNKKRLGLNYENLQGKIIVEFDDGFVDGIAYLEIERNGEKGYLLMTKENESYTLEIKSSLLNVVGQINMQIRITESEQNLEIPVWKSNIFYLVVEKAINSTTEIPDEYPSWIDTANAKLQEIDNLNIEAVKVDHTATITITAKDGTENTIEINDGEPGSPGAQGPKGDTGDQGPAGQNGRDGVIQYTPGNNVTIENNVISVDLSGKQDIIQYATLPTPSVDYLGKIFQYTGATNDYVNGHFYLCINDGGTYSWQEVPFGGGETGETATYYIVDAKNTPNFTIGSFTIGNEDKPKYIEILTDALTKGYKAIVVYLFGSLSASIYELYFNISNASLTDTYSTITVGQFYNTMRNDGIKTLAYKGGTQTNKAYDYITMEMQTRNGEIIDIITLSGNMGIDKYLGVNNTYEYTPTANYHPATKKYVDDHASGGPTIDEVQILSLSSSIMSGLASMQRSSIASGTNKTIILKLINDMISSGKTSTYFINRLDDYFTIFRMIIPSETTGTQTVRLYMEPNPSKLTELKYGETYWISKTINVTYTDNVATDFTIPSSGYTQQEWKYLRFGNTNSFTPTRDYEPSTKKYVDDLVGDIQTLLEAI